MTDRGTVYQVLPPNADSLGGAEKRVVGLWLHIARQGLADVRLVINERLMPLLREVDEFADIDRYRDKILTVRGGRLASFRLRRLLHGVRVRDPRAVYHLVMVTPGLISPVPTSRTLYSIAAASLTNFNTRGLLDIYLACLRAERTDALDPDVGRDLGRILPSRRSAISVTPGSFVDLELFAPLPAREKKNRLVFLGTFIRNKQVFRLLEQIPEIYAGLQARGVRDVEFDFLGRDAPTEPSATRIVARLAERIPIRAFFATRPSEVLRESKVYFALQRLENYPSKALLEAMACGCLPIVTDVGKSRQIAREDFAFFVPGTFQSAEIVDAASAILSLSAEEHDRRVAIARTFLRERFGIDAMAEYYLDLYARLAARDRPAVAEPWARW